MSATPPLERILTLLERGAAVECAVRALIAAHPDPAEVRKVFEQLASQTQAGAAARGAPVGPAFHAAAEALFAPPTELDAEHPSGE